MDMYTSSDTRWEWPGEGTLFEQNSNKRGRSKMGPLFKSPPKSLLKSCLHQLGRYGTHQETIRRPEQIYTLTQDRNGLGRDYY